MAFIPPQVINIGGYANDGTGDDLRTAFAKVNQNFSLINSELGVTSAANIGDTGEGVYSDKVDNILQFKKITGGGGVTVTSTDEAVIISALANVVDDTSPSLGGTLDLNGNNIVGTGDVQSTVWGLAIRTINAQLQAATGEDLDFGTFTTPNTVNLDFGTF